MDNKIKNALTNYGLSEDEVKVYLSMLASNQSSILKIADDTKIKRSTVYLIMSSLINKKLARRSIVGKKKFYFAENPKTILDEMNQKKNAIEEILPLLKEQYKENKNKPKVYFYEGREGVEKIYDEIANLKPVKEILYFGSHKEIDEEFKESLQKIDDTLVYLDNFVGSRLIANDTKLDREYGKKIMSDKRYNYPMKSRLLPKDLFFQNANGCIYENKMALFSIKHDFFVIVIESADIVNAYRTLFDQAWRTTVKIDN